MAKNLANLLLARGLTRRREIATRFALGASRVRIVRQLLTESIMLAAAAGSAATLVSWWLARVMTTALGTPGLALHVDAFWLLLAVALSLVAAVSFGLGPALLATRPAVSASMHPDGGATATLAPRSLWSPRHLLVVVPLSVSLMLLIAAVVTLRFVDRASFVRDGFDTAHLLTMSFRLKAQGYDEARITQFQDALRERMAGEPGVSAVALAAAGPVRSGAGVLPLFVEGEAMTPTVARHAAYDVVSPEYFELLGTRAVRGRTFVASDREGSNPVAVVSQEVARRYWPDKPDRQANPDGPADTIPRGDWPRSRSGQSAADVTSADGLCPSRPGEVAASEAPRRCHAIRCSLSARRRGAETVAPCSRSLGCPGALGGRANVGGPAPSQCGPVQGHLVAPDSAWGARVGDGGDWRVRRPGVRRQPANAGRSVSAWPLERSDPTS